MTEWSGRFGARTTADEVVADLDLSGQVVVVTGANCGIGFHAARALASGGARVIFACRDSVSGSDAVERALAEHPGALVEVSNLDLSSRQSIRAFAERIDADSIDTLICNAGVFGGPYQEVDGGIERTVGVCHVGHFLLVQALLPKLVSGGGGRVVMVSSESHRTPSSLEFDRLPLTAAQYSGFVAYGQAKLCNVLFANELQRRHAAEGLTACSLHPGSMISTKIGRHSLLAGFAISLLRPFTKSLSVGAATSVVCATHPHRDEVAGRYFSDCRPKPASEEAQNTEVAGRLWEKTEEWVRDD
jgi:WW domain-containing oxidoreductase